MSACYSFKSSKALQLKAGFSVLVGHLCQLFRCLIKLVTLKELFLFSNLLNNHLDRKDKRDGQLLAHADTLSDCLKRIKRRQPSHYEH